MNEKEMYNILIVGGSNKIFLDSKHLIVNLQNNFSSRLANIISTYPNASIDLIDSVENTSFLNDPDALERVFTYDNIDSLKVVLKCLNYKNYDLILNTANMISLDVINGKIKIFDYNLNISNFFPNVPIINLKDLNPVQEKNLEQLLIKESEYQNNTDEKIKSLIE